MLVPSCPMMHIARPVLLVLGLLLLLANAESKCHFFSLLHSLSSVCALVGKKDVSYKWSYDI